MLEAVFFSDVINFRLEQVVPRGFRFRSSSPSRVYVDYYFYVYGRMAVWVLMPNWS